VRRRDLSYVDAAIDGSPAPDRPAWSPASRRSRWVRRPDWPVGCRSWAPAGEAVELAWNPEFLREGFAVRTRCTRPAGLWGRDADAEAKLREAFAPVIEAGCPVVVTTSRPPSWSRSRRTRSWHQDLVHQRDGRGVRDVHADVTQLARRSGTTTDRGKFLRAGLGLAAAACPRTSGVHGRAGESAPTRL